jgi:hypothetical protein
VWQTAHALPPTRALLQVLFAASDEDIFDASGGKSFYRGCAVAAFCSAMATLLLMLPTAPPAPVTHHIRCMTTSNVNQFNRHLFCYQASLGETSSYGCPSKGMFRTHPKPNLCIYFFSNRGAKDGSDSDDDGPQVDFSQVDLSPPHHNRFSLHDF